MNNTAVFIGHNECYGVSAQQVEQAIIDFINQGVTVFMSGGQGGFDRLCAGCVHRLKKAISRYYKLPCYSVSNFYRV